MSREQFAASRQPNPLYQCDPEAGGSKKVVGRLQTVFGASAINTS